MRRPAMMEFAKVSNTLAVTVKSVIQNLNLLQRDL